MNRSLPGLILWLFGAIGAILFLASSKAPASQLTVQARQSAAAASQLPEKFADLPGVRICYLDSGGTGEPVVFLHPGTGSRRVWEHQIPAFTAAGYRFIAYDRRGHGRTVVDPAVAPGSSADDLKALLDHLKLDRIHLVGSAGGAITAMDFALSFPERIRSLVIANSIVGVQDKEYTEMGKRLRPRQFEELPPEIRELGPSYRAANPDGAQRWIDLEKASKSEGPRPASQKARNRITFAALETLRMPVLLMTGDADLYTPPSVLRMFAPHIKQAKAIIIPEAGHSAYWEQPEIFNRHALQFIRTHSRKGNQQ